MKDDGEISEYVRFSVYRDRLAKSGPVAGRCSASVPDGGRWPTDHQCMRKPVLNEYGYGWCKAHAPSTVKAKREVDNARYEAENARRNFGYAVERASKAITDKAIDAAHQRCSIDDVFAAVGEYERLKAELESMP